MYLLKVLYSSIECTPTCFSNVLTFVGNGAIIMSDVNEVAINSQSYGAVHTTPMLESLSENVKQVFMIISGLAKKNFK